jgi:hypothetical protein
MFIFIDESGITDVKSEQKYLVVAFALMRNRAFADELIFEIKDKCKKKGKQIKYEVKYHSLEPLQKEVAIDCINSRYRNFYICFIDLEKSHKSMITGKHEHKIQTIMVHNLLSSINSRDLKNDKELKIIMDKKLSGKYQDSIKYELRKHFGSKKGLSVKTASSSKERGIQIADIIAGAFRAKLMKKSDLFEVNLTHVFQVTIPDTDVFKTGNIKEV